MIKKISIASMTLFLFIAVFLYSLGVREARIGTHFMSFLNQCNIELAGYHLTIPNITLISKEDFVLPDWLEWLDFLRQALNGILSIINFFIPMLNFIAQSLVYLFVVIKNFQNMINAISQDVNTSHQQFIATMLIGLHSS